MFAHLLLLLLLLLALLPKPFAAILERATRAVQVVLLATPVRRI